MLIKHFTMTGVRVPDPLRPCRTAVLGRLQASGNSALSYVDEAGERVEAKPNRGGWFEVPHEVGTALCKIRTGGSGFRSPGEVEEELRLGLVDDEPTPPKASKQSAAS